MIHIFKSKDELGISLFDGNTGKFLFGEVCSKDRLITFINNFPEHNIVIFVERGWQEEVEEIFFLLPHLENRAEVKTLKKINVANRIALSAKKKKSKRVTFFAFYLGLILGCLILLPTSMEYKQSVLVKAKSTLTYTQELNKNRPDTQEKMQLYNSMVDLSHIHHVEAITYTSGSYKVLFSSEKDNLTNKDLKGFETSTLNKISVNENQDDGIVFVYELEGSL